jgi:hypothetical protein
VIALEHLTDQELLERKDLVRGTAALCRGRGEHAEATKLDLDLARIHRELLVRNQPLAEALAR